MDERETWACARCQTTNTAKGNCEACESPPDWAPPVPPQTIAQPQHEQAPQETKPAFDLIGGLLRMRDLCLLSESPAALRHQIYNDAVVLEGWIREQFAKDRTAAIPASAFSLHTGTDSP